jgi:hypothetical protein
MRPAATQICGLVLACALWPLFAQRAVGPATQLAIGTAMPVTSPAGLTPDSPRVVEGADGVMANWVSPQSTLTAAHDA